MRSCFCTCRLRPMKVHDWAALRHALAEAVPSAQPANHAEPAGARSCPGRTGGGGGGLRLPGSPAVGAFAPDRGTRLPCSGAHCPGRNPSGIQMPQALALQKAMTEQALPRYWSPYGVNRILSTLQRRTHSPPPQSRGAPALTGSHMRALGPGFLILDRRYGHFRARRHALGAVASSGLAQVLCMC